MDLASLLADVPDQVAPLVQFTPLALELHPTSPPCHHRQRGGVGRSTVRGYRGEGLPGHHTTNEGGMSSRQGGGAYEEGTDDVGATSREVGGA